MEANVINLNTDWIFVSIKEVVEIVLIFRYDSGFVYKIEYSSKIHTEIFIEKVVSMEFLCK